MIVQPTHSEPETWPQDQPFDDCPSQIGVAQAWRPNPAAAALPLLRRALAGAGAGPDVSGATIVRERDRAPRLATCSGWRLSLSHSGCSIAAAASPVFAVGIDLECHRSRDFSRLARLLGWSATNASTFYPRWTLAEALYKAGAASSSACFAAAEQALEAAGDKVPAALYLELEQRPWQARWRHEPAAAARPATSTCIVWSTVA